MTRCRARAHAPLLTPSESPESMGLSCEVSLRSDRVSSRQDCDIAGHGGSCNGSEQLALHGAVLPRGCRGLSTGEAECPSTQPTAGSACAGTVEG